MTTEAGFQDIIPAPYGQACEECARSKTKCMLGGQGGSCQRCRRLDRDCHPAPARRRRRQIMKNNSSRTKSVPAATEDAEKTKRLEEKLQEVMTLLKSGGSLPTTATNMPTPQTSMDDASSVISSIHPSSPSSTDIVVDLSPIDADNLLATFITSKLQYFPVCHISSNLTSSRLRAQQPFLWLSIMAISATSMSQHRQLSLAFKEQLSQAMLKRSERSLDLLLGILVMLAWNNCSTDTETKVPLAVLSQLALALVYDLGLNNRPRSNTQHNMCVIKPKPNDASENRTMQERRAALGCFVITSIISSYLQKIDALRWTAHLAESLSELANQRECPNDLILVAQAKAHLGVEKALILLWYDESIETAETLKVPPALYVQALHTQIAEAQKNLPTQQLPRSIASLHLITAEIILDELALNSLTPPMSPTNLQTLKLLTACLASIKSWFDTFFSIPIAEYTSFGFSIMSQLVRSLQMLYRLTTLEDSALIGWNTADVRVSLDVLEVMDRVISNLAQVTSMTKMQEVDELDYFSSVLQRFSFIRVGWASSLEKDNTGPDSIGSSATLWRPGPDELLAFDDWSVAWLDDDWSMDFGLAKGIGVT